MPRLRGVSWNVDGLELHSQRRDEKLSLIISWARDYDYVFLQEVHCFQVDKDFDTLSVIFKSFHVTYSPLDGASGGVVILLNKKRFKQGMWKEIFIKKGRIMGLRIKEKEQECRPIRGEVYRELTCRLTQDSTLPADHKTVP